MNVVAKMIAMITANAFTVTACLLLSNFLFGMNSNNNSDGQ